MHLQPVRIGTASRRMPPQHAARHGQRVIHDAPHDQMCLEHIGWSCPSIDDIDAVELVDQLRFNYLHRNPFSSIWITAPVRPAPTVGRTGTGTLTLARV